jgi:thiamine biosynthesis lipoprotein
MKLVLWLVLIAFTFETTFSQGETYSLMGTYAYIDLGSKKLNLLAYKYLREIEFKLSDYIDTSEVSRVNSNAGKCFIKVSDVTLDLMKKSIEVSEKTFGYFDVTIGAVTINARRLGKLPQDSARKLVNFKDILIQNDSIMLRKEGMAIDLGGIGKGFAVEQVYRHLKTNYGFISIGGDMKVWGHKRTLAIKDPINDGSLVQMVNSKDVSLSTSGNYYRRHIDVEDDEVIQITVAHEDATYADAYATALFAMPRDLRQKFLKENDVGVLILYKDGSIYINNKFRDFFEMIILKGGSQYISKTKEMRK